MVLESNRCFTSSVEGLNVINDPKRNEVLNVIIFCPNCNKVLNVNKPLSCKLQELLKKAPHLGVAGGEFNI